MGRASALHRLQQVDSEILRRRTRGEQISAILSNSAELRTIRDALQHNQEELDGVQAEYREAERAVQDQRAKIEQTEQTLYGGAVTNPKELQDLQLESESLKRHLETLEDRLLEAMLEQDEVRGRQQALTGQLASLERQTATEHAALLAERDQLDAELATLQTEREATTGSVSAGDLQRYAVLIERTGGLAVAVLEDDTCGACGLTIPPSIRQNVRSGPDPVNCPQCGRILYAG